MPTTNQSVTIIIEYVTHAIFQETYKSPEFRLTLETQNETLLLPANPCVVMFVIGVESQDGRVQVGQFERGVISGDHSQRVHVQAAVGVVSP